MTILDLSFFDRDACLVARDLLGTIIRRKYRNKWLSARIIETEAYYLEEKGSHASLGFTDKRKALFMPAGTIYMYYARGKDSLNVSCRGEGNAVLIKSAFPYKDQHTHPDALKIMKLLNPAVSGMARETAKLCAGQTLLCRSLDLKVTDWDQKNFQKTCFYIDNINQPAETIIQTKRLGIPAGRDEHLNYRFVDFSHAQYCSSNPLTKRNAVEDKDYFIIKTTKF